MSDNKLYFIDSNILIYAVADDDYKRNIANNLLKSNHIVISTQVLNEFCNVILRKNILSYDDLLKAVKSFSKNFTVVNVDSDLIIYALNVKNRYHYSYWDSVMIASALNAGVPILYSEDMHHHHVY
ncbi:MAG: PIN domain-containing protein [Acinetobacter sp.]|nr:PIN domain-containing protein [Acinetobacter sp.]